MLKIEVDITYVNNATICFKNRIALNLINIIQVITLIGTTKFHVVDIFTSFFLYIKDMDTLNIYLNNITN